MVKGPVSLRALTALKTLRVFQINRYGNEIPMWVRVPLPVETEYHKTSTQSVLDASNLEVTNFMMIKKLIYNFDMDTITFKVISWQDWSDDLMKRVLSEIQNNMDFDLEDLVYGPALDPENPKPFCSNFMFNALYEDRVFVRHHTYKDSYWFINGDSTCLLYKPKLQ